MLWLLNLTDLFYLKSIKPQKTYILLVQVCSARGWKELKVSYGRSSVTSASPLPPQNKKNKTHTAPSNTTPVHTSISQHGKWFHDIWWLWEISWSQSSSHRISTRFTNTHWILIILHFCGEFQLWRCFIHMFWKVSSSEPNLSHGIHLVTWTRCLQSRPWWLGKQRGNLHGTLPCNKS